MHICKNPGLHIPRVTITISHHHTETFHLHHESKTTNRYFNICFCSKKVPWPLIPAVLNLRYILKIFEKKKSITANTQTHTGSSTHTHTHNPTRTSPHTQNHPHRQAHIWKYFISWLYCELKFIPSAEIPWVSVELFRISIFVVALVSSAHVHL